MIWELPNTEIFPVLDGLSSGLVGTVAVRLVDVSTDETVIERRTEDITEIAPGVYRATLTSPATQGAYLIIWDAGHPEDPEGTFTEDLEVTRSPVGDAFIGEDTSPTYLTVPELKATLNIGSQIADEDLARAVRAASRAVDELVDTRFYVTADPETRRFSPERPRILEIDDLAEFVSLTVAGQEWRQHTDFEFRPLNAAQLGRPYRTVHLLSGRFWLPDVWRSGVYQTVAITGRYGWLETPDQIKEVVSILATQLAKRTRDTPWGVVTSLGTDTSSAIRIARTDPHITQLLEPFDRRPEIF